MPDRHLTYDRYVLHSLMPATGWEGVWYSAEQGHWTTPIHALALATERTYDAKTWEQVMDRSALPEEEYRILVALEYTPSGGWDVCESHESYCGLLPPGWTLDEFNQCAGCAHAAILNASAAPEPPQG